MRRLSSPITELKPAYEVVVIGSGYGGSIAASRMARCGLKVCLLEKGKEFLPGEFPSGLGEAAKEMQVTKGKTHIGEENGLYEFVAGDDISVFKGCGLGGTSLVNANVSIEAEERVFDDPCWPKEIQMNPELLSEGIARAREMLRPVPYPEGKNGYPVLAKTLGMKKSAQAMHAPFRLLDINVNFEDQYNHVGVEQKKCNNCGDCVTGCNQTAKNTTQMNYLPDAKNHGAEIFTEAGVRYIKRVGEKWLVYFDMYHTGREKFDAPSLFVKADKVFLCAGSLGSTEILLRSAERGLDVSNMLGKRFTGNGDVLGFGYNCDQEIHGIGLGDNTKEGEIANVGPCITSVIDMRHQPNLEDGMTLEEGSIPGPIRFILKSSLVPISRLFGIDTDRNFKDNLKEKWREIQSLFGGVYKGAVDNTQVYLVMTHDDGSGVMSLDHDRINIQWKGVGKQDIFQKVSDQLRNATKALGGTFLKNPTWTKLLDYDLVTVHPLGGCVMGEDASTGVVDHKGQVFAGKSGTSLHAGLYVMDGAILPRSVGTNPLLTISGLAERNCKIIAEEMGRPLDYSFPPIQKKDEVMPTVGIQFTETMTGYFSTTEKGDYQKAFEKGKEENSPFAFTLTIQSQDVDAFVADPGHECGMIGTVIAPALSAHPLRTSRGKFNLFVASEDEPGRKKMNYEMQLHASEDKYYFFKGFKDIYDDKGVDVWKDTTVLYITVFSGQDENGEIIGKGMLKIEIADFARQLTTMKAVHAKSKTEGLQAVGKFGKLFAGNVWETFFKNGD